MDKIKCGTQIRPILFTTDMVHGLMDERKFQTRRLVKGVALEWLRECGFDADYVAHPDNHMCPYGNPGDILYVRETFQYYNKNEQLAVLYRADAGAQEILETFHDPKWRPNIFMPKKLARIWLRIESRHIEPLQCISEADAIDEGIQPLLMSSAQFAQYGRLYKNYEKQGDGIFNEGCQPVESFRTLFSSIHSKEMWNADPWVWVIKFSILLDLTKPLPDGATFDAETLTYSFTTGKKSVSIKL